MQKGKSQKCFVNGRLTRRGYKMTESRGHKIGRNRNWQHRVIFSGEYCKHLNESTDDKS